MEQMIKDDKQKAFIAPDVIISMLTTDDKSSNEVLTQSLIKLITSDFALYEALMSITKDELKLSNLTEFLLRVQIVPSPKISIDMERIEKLRKFAKLGKLNKKVKKNG